jgi:hypothetical protein
MYTKTIVFAAPFLTAVLASPAAQPAANPVVDGQVLATASPVDWSPTKTRRDLTGDIKSVLGSLGSNIPSYVASGVANFFQNFPSGTAVQSSLGLNDSQLAAIPTQVLNVP